MRRSETIEPGWLDVPSLSTIRDIRHEPGWLDVPSLSTIRDIRHEPGGSAGFVVHAMLIETVLAE